MFNESEFNEVGFNEDRVSLISKVFLAVKDIRGFMVDRTSLMTSDIRNFAGKTSLMVFDIMGLATARKIKAVVRDIRVRFRIK